MSKLFSAWQKYNQTTTFPIGLILLMDFVIHLHVNIVPLITVSYNMKSPSRAQTKECDFVHLCCISSDEKRLVHFIGFFSKFVMGLIVVVLRLLN